MSVTARAMYERQRRRRLSNQRRKQEILFEWLRIKRPEILEEFGVFFRILDERNKHIKNLTTSVDFRRFCSEAKGK